MTPVYEVKTKHTMEVLEDFVDFTFKVKHPSATFTIAVFGLCFYTMAYAIRNQAGPFGIGVCLVLGTLILIFALIRKKIAAKKLSKVDPSYQNQSEICFVFGEREFTIEDETGLKHWKYGEVPYMYGDKKYYYISINNEMIHMIPKKDFVLGDSEAFYQYISNKTGKDIMPTYIPWKIRIRMMMEYRDARAKEQEK